MYKRVEEWLSFLSLKLTNDGNVTKGKISISFCQPIVNIISRGEGTTHKVGN
jgi:hypothetical protein